MTGAYPLFEDDFDERIDSFCFNKRFDMARLINGLMGPDFLVGSKDDATILQRQHGAVAEVHAIATTARGEAEVPGLGAVSEDEEVVGIGRYQDESGKLLFSMYYLM